MWGLSSSKKRFPQKGQSSWNFLLWRNSSECAQNFPVQAGQVTQKSLAIVVSRRQVPHVRSTCGAPAPAINCSVSRLRSGQAYGSAVLCSTNIPFRGRCPRLSHSTPSGLESLSLLLIRRLKPTATHRLALQARKDPRFQIPRSKNKPTAQTACRGYPSQAKSRSFVAVLLPSAALPSTKLGACGAGRMTAPEASNNQEQAHGTKIVPWLPMPRRCGASRETWAGRRGFPNPRSSRAETLRAPWPERGREPRRLFRRAWWRQ